jgi:hypothetical protein
MSDETEVLDVTLPDGRRAKAVPYSTPQAPPTSTPPMPPQAPPTALEQFYAARARSPFRAAAFVKGNWRAIAGDIAAKHGR